MKKFGVFFVFILFWPISVLAENQLFISQVQITGGTGKTAEDFIELFNPGDVPANLNGYRLVKRTENGTTDTLIKSWTTDISIPARSFYLWANSGFSGISAVPDITTSGTISDNNGIALRFGANDIGAIISSVAWGSASNGFLNVSTLNPEANFSLKRQNLYLNVSSFSITDSSPRNSLIQESVPPSTPDTTASSTPDVPTSTPDTLGTTTPESIATTTPNLVLSQNSTTTQQSASVGGGRVFNASDYIKINEIMANPEGEDEGKEWVEIINLSGTQIYLGSYALDVSGKATTTSAVYFDSKAFLPANGFYVLKIPEGKLSMTNTKKSVGLFEPNGKLLDSITYENAPEEKSWQKNKEGKWSYNFPTAGLQNDFQPVLSTVFISEILPNPSESQDEFVEIYNPSLEELDLEGFAVQIGNRNKLLEKGKNIKPKSYLVFFEEELPANLRNTGQEVKFLDKWGRVVAEVKYPEAKKGYSYASLDGKNFTWTSSVTLGTQNNLVLGESIILNSDAGNEKPKNTTSIKNSKEVSVSEYKKLAQDNLELKDQLFTLQESVNNLSQKLDAQEEPAQDQSKETTNKSKKSSLYIIFAGLLGLSGVVGFYLKTTPKV